MWFRGGAQGGTGGAFAPPSLYVKKGPDISYIYMVKTTDNR